MTLAATLPPLPSFPTISRREVAALEQHEASRSTAAKTLAADLLAAITAGDLSDLAHFLPQPSGRAKSTVGAVAEEALDGFGERGAVLVLLAHIAAGKASRADAAAMLGRIVGEWADANAELAL